MTPCPHCGSLVGSVPHLIDAECLPHLRSALASARSERDEAQRLLEAREHVHRRDIDEMIGILGRPVINRAREVVRELASARSEVARLTEERDEARAALLGAITDTRLLARAEAAEATAERLRGALREALWILRHLGKPFSFVETQRATKAMGLVIRALAASSGDPAPGTTGTNDEGSKP